MLAFDELKENLSRIMRTRLVKESPLRRAGLAGVLVLVTLIVVMWDVMPARLDLEVGQPCPRDVYAQKTIVDRRKLESLKQQRLATLEEVYDRKPGVLPEIELQIETIFANIEAAGAEGNLATEKKAAKLRELLKQFSPSEAAVQALLVAGTEKISAMRESVAGLIRQVMQRDIRQEALEGARAEIEAAALRLEFGEPVNRLLATIGCQLLRPNMVFNQAATERRRIEALQELERNPPRILKDQNIIRRGDTVTEEHMAILEELGLVRKPADGKQVDLATPAGVVVLTLTLCALVAVYVARFEKDICARESRILLVGIIVTGILLLAKGLGPISPLLIPVAAASMLITILLGWRPAMLFTVMLSVFVGLMNGNELRYVVFCLIGGLSAMYSVSGLSQRGDLQRAGFIVSGANMVSIASMCLMASTPLRAALLQAGWGVLNGLVAAVLTIGCLPYLENAFGITTPVRLLELSNPNQPLLRRLLVEAPGTYHHSVIVGNLAEAGAEAVGAEALLARVGAYYHDIGKTRRPYFFIDNQLGADNPHDRISPSLSALIITAHVKDGVEMAREAGLPPAIIDLIREHHGTTLVSYFFQRATENDKYEVVLENHFRYSGPKPQTKEAAVLMLADAVEAGARALPRPLPGKIEWLVRKIIKDRLADGQLDECELTLKELDRIAEAFTKVLTGIFHRRVEYPEGAPPEAERGKNKGGHAGEQRPG